MNRSSSVADPGEVSHPGAQYRAAFEQRSADVHTLSHRARQVEIARLLIFVVGAVAASVRNELPLPTALPTGFALVALVGFFWMVVHHRQLKMALRRQEAALLLSEAGMHRTSRNWEGLAEAYERFGAVDPLLETTSGQDDTHPYIVDLDIFGPASIRGLLGPTPTPVGSATVAQWLTAPATPSEIRGRQPAVRGLADDVVGRESLTVEALLIDPMDPAQWAGFSKWLATPPVFDPTQGGALPAWAVIASRVLPAVSVPLFVAWVAGLPVPFAAWALLWVVQTALAWRWGKALTPFLDRASRFSRGLRGHHRLFAAWEGYVGPTPELSTRLNRLGGETGHPASEEIRKLERLLDAADSRASMLHHVISPILLWDVHVARGLEQWRVRAGSHVGDWFDTLGELEALSAFATLAHDQPSWVFPEFDESAVGLKAEGLGHPLLSDDVVRTSDVSLDAPGRYLLVTGSNMSGKSTLLRSIGLAAVLGQTGSVVCATSVVLSPLRTFSSMRIRDSLTGGVSLFMAELLRLKALVDAAAAGPGEPALLYLIDEVLQGTNSEERRVAARRIVTHLLASNAIGAVTTHDLTLHDDPQLDPTSTKVHFRETVEEKGDRVLSFDYVLRPGLATSRNALKLLKIVGLDVGAADGVAESPAEGTAESESATF